LVTKHLMKFPVSIFLERGEDVKRQLRCLLWKPKLCENMNAGHKLRDDIEP
jgi:hypothetical protein